MNTQQAANILNVSHDFLLKLLESGEIPCHGVGSYRQIRFEDVMSYKEKIYSQRMQALDELVAQAQELNMGYE